MQTNRFVRQVQLHLLGGNEHKPTAAEAEKAIAVTLQTLAECLNPEQAQKLASHLPTTINQPLLLLTQRPLTTLPKFFLLVAQREKMPLAFAIHHTRTVIAILQKAVPLPIIEEIRSHLPPDFDVLFPKKHAP